VKALTIITACSRSENLPALAESIGPGKAYFNLAWLISVDGGEYPESRVGNAQKNRALEHIGNEAESWVYFLDDDNLIYPGFFMAIARAIKKLPGKRGFIFLQDCGSFVRQAAPDGRHRQRGGADQALVGGQLDHASQAQLALNGRDGLPGLVREDVAQGAARRGAAGHGMAGHGKARQVWRGWAWQELRAALGGGGLPALPREPGAEERQGDAGLGGLPDAAGQAHLQDRVGDGEPF